MSSIKGTYQLIFDDLRWYFMLFSTITLGLSVIYLLISFMFNIPSGTEAALFGPTFGGICTFAVAGLVIPIQVAIGLGSTRVQFLKSYNVMASLMVVASITFLNLLYLIMNFLFDKGINKFHFFHAGEWYSTNYHFFSYYWIDLMIGFFILGISSLIAVLIRRLGVLNFLILLVGISIIITLSSITGYIPTIFGWILENNVLMIFTILGIVGMILQSLTFPMMKNAPLKMKSRE
ncbi:hypothetical protein [Gottfriedia solisilvae]|uniref:Uncharacterized protein n=1 Tax=Gottfriedia solisilvae TaxID=1516104 RepID=A0A8J3AHV9_9BACI|nr:hypothetical protein [Gottfriedia solisilvae]GGI13119.1 hypothetical protein GCM10007380_16320 [Gottfriedia solisilvae]